MSKAYEHITYEVDDPTATITLDRPERLNAWTPTMEREVKEALAEAQADPAVVGIILTGAGRAFCAGADMGTLQSLVDGAPIDTLQQRTAAVSGSDGIDVGFRRTYSYLASIPKPIIAAINGPCVGMAVPIACFSDMRFASERAYFMTAFSRRGLVAEWGSSWILPRLVGHANAFDLLFSSRKVLADEALRMGLVNRVTPHDELLAEVRVYIEMLAEHCSPSSIAAMKSQIYNDLMNPLDGALTEANRLMLASFTSDDFHEGIAAFLEKRPPKFGRIQ